MWEILHMRHLRTITKKPEAAVTNYVILKEFFAGILDEIIRLQRQMPWKANIG